MASDLERTLAWLVLEPAKCSINEPLHRLLSILRMKLTFTTSRRGGFDDEVKDECEYDRLAGRRWGDGDRPNFGEPN